jgi:hypothetical protein
MGAYGLEEFGACGGERMRRFLAEVVFKRFGRGER